MPTDDGCGFDIHFWLQMSDLSITRVAVELNKLDNFIELD